jgi:predicted phage baseplate assembly protein
MTAPLTIYGNLIEVTRGETVANEVLGSADATIAFQTFKLKQKPLTYVADPNDPDRVRPQLDVRVNGILWRRVRSFLEAKPDDQVYVVRQNEAGESLVIFGETVRPPSGVNNVTASYRHGAGAAKPPAGAIAQLARPVERLRSAFNPVGARGGSDAESPRDVRRNGPRAALTLGRAISLPDFEALARAYPGVVNATAAWAWDAGYQRAAVRVWVVSDGASIAGDVASSLRAQSDPNVPLSVAEAIRVPTALIIDLEIDPRATGDLVRAAVRDALIDPVTGALALPNVQVGRPMFRSFVLQKIMAVSGVLSVRSLVLDGAAAPAAFPGVEGEIRDFTNLTVG